MGSRGIWCPFCVGTAASTATRRPRSAWHAAAPWRTRWTRSCTLCEGALVLLRKSPRVYVVFTSHTVFFLSLSSSPILLLHHLFLSLSKRCSRLSSAALLTTQRDFFLRTDSIVDGAVMQAAFHVPMSEALPLAARPDRLQPGSSRIALFGRHVQDTSNVSVRTPSTHLGQTDLLFLPLPPLTPTHPPTLRLSSLILRAPALPPFDTNSPTHPLTL